MDNLGMAMTRDDRGKMTAVPGSMRELIAFSAEQVSRLTGLSLRQLQYWDETEFFSSEYAPGYRRAAFSRVYSFRDLVGLSAIGLLRRQHKIPLQELRRVGAYLHGHSDTPWASITLYVSGREIIFRDPNTDMPDEFTGASTPGQRVLPINMEVIARATQEKTEQLMARGQTQVGRVAKNRFVVHNMPVLAGTRIPTSAIWNLHAAGYSTRSIIAEFPRLFPRDVQVAIQYERARRNRKAG
jgi:uncharacterized protein (DUF433 family)